MTTVRVSSASLLLFAVSGRRGPRLRRIVLLVVVLTLLLLPIAVAQKKNGTERNIKIINESGYRVELYWVHPKTGETSLMSKPGGILSGTTFPLDSFTTHKFEVRELPHSKTNKCVQEECRNGAYFAVNHNYNQVFTIMPDMQIFHADDKSVARDRAAELMTDCKVASIKAMARRQGATKEQVLRDVAACVNKSVLETVEELTEEIAFQMHIRKGMGEQFETYTCADDELETSDEFDKSVWINKSKKYTVKKLHDRPSSKIHVVENFVTLEECQAMEESAKYKLGVASVADHKGGHKVDDVRKAMQADIAVPWGEPTHPITTLSQRVYDYTNHVLKLNINGDGQENLMSIQYTGRGEDDPSPDQYKPHCDGFCRGDTHMTGGRIATMVMYCTIPQKGGATNFRNAGVHVKPAVGNAVFFSYMDPATKRMDSGFTEHSGCPVLVGEKKIITQWVRLGVDKENPWDSFNSLGIKKSEFERQNKDS